jgi:hypothetical protein
MYYIIIKILTIIKKYLNGWWITDIFHDGYKGYIEYDTPSVDFFGTSYGYFYNDFTYTKLGSWFEDAPMIFSILKIFYYIPAWVAWFITNLLWVIIMVCLPKSIRNNL